MLSSLLKELDLKFSLYEEENYIALTLLYKKRNKDFYLYKFFESYEGKSKIITDISNWLNTSKNTNIVFNQSVSNILSEQLIKERHNENKRLEFKTKKLKKEDRINILNAKIDIKINQALENKNKESFLINSKRKQILKKIKETIQ